MIDKGLWIDVTDRPPSPMIPGQSACCPPQGLIPSKAPIGARAQQEATIDERCHRLLLRDDLPGAARHAGGPRGRGLAAQRAPRASTRCFGSAHAGGTGVPAAAIAYGLDQEKDQKLIVYDLGGGTFDVSILEIVNNNFQVKAVGGDSRLGGDDFDLAIMTWASQKFQAETGIDLLGNSSKAGKVARQRLKEAAETAKIELSQAKSAILAVPDCLGHPLEQEISLSEYNELIAPLLQKTVDCMKSVLRDAGLDADDIDRVILVGGSTKNQAVQEIVTREIKEPFVAERVDEVVSHGAAIVAANLSLPDAVDIEFSDVTAHSLGVDMLDLDNKIFFQPIITRNTTYPCRKGMLAYSNRPHQKEVKMNVFRGEDHDPKKNMGLGELTLPISPPQPEQIPIAAIFDLDADGIIHFTAVQLPLGKLSDSIVQYATEQNSALDIPAVEALIASGQAKSTTISVNSKQP